MASPTPTTITTDDLNAQFQAVLSGLSAERAAATKQNDDQNALNLINASLATDATAVAAATTSTNGAVTTLEATLAGITSGSIVVVPPPVTPPTPAAAKPAGS